VSDREDLTPEEDLGTDLGPEPASTSLDAEGIPDHEGPLDTKVASGDGQEGLVPPGDAPLGADRAVTAAEQRDGSTLDERLAIEEPDRPATPDRPSPELVDEDRPDDEADLVGAVGGTNDGISAEEAAVHLTEDPPGATDDDDDGYVAEDGSMAP
jgi:hypothetical protein